MPRTKKRLPTLSLFGERPTRERAWELVEKFPLDSTISAEYQTIRGKKYGPYYRVRVGRERKVNVGPAAKRELELAWDVVRDELAAAESTPEVRRLRELEKRAGKLARTSVTVPIDDEVAMSRPK